MKLESNRTNNQSSIIDNHLAKPSTSVEKTLQISSFMQNKANSPNVQLNLNIFITKNYAISNCLTKVKNKPNSKPIQTQSKPILGQYQGCQSQNKPKQTQKMNAFTWIMSVTMIYYNILMAFTALYGGLCAVNHIRTLIRARINTGQKWSISKTNH